MRVNTRPSLDRNSDAEQSTVIPYRRDDDAGVDGSGPRPIVVPHAKCGVVIVSYRTGSVLLDCLHSVLAQPVVSHVVLVDNGNDPATRGALTELTSHDDRLEIIVGHGNVGFSKGCNLGARRISAEYLLLLNPDSHMGEGVLAEALRAFETDPEASAVTVRLENPDGSEQRGGRRNLLTPWTSLVEQFRLDRLMPDHPHFQRLNLNETEPLSEITEVECISGAFMLMPKQVFDDLGGMDEDYFLHVEDIDFCMKIAKADGHILYVPHVSVTHEQGTSRVYQTFVEWHKARSAVRYFFKHFQPQYPTFLLRMIAVAIFTRFTIRLLPQTLRWLAQSLSSKT